MLTHRRQVQPADQRGLSLVEMMVGIAVGMFIVAGTTKLFVDYLGSNRILLVETRVNQDLRAAADLVARDLRRAGYWRNAETGISSTLGVLPVDNPYEAVAYDAGTGELTYSYAKDADNAINAGTEAFGVRRVAVSGTGVLQLRTAGGWQTITDPGTLDIPAGATGLTITPTAPRIVPLFDDCTCIFELTCNRNQFLDPNPDTAATGIYFANRPRLTVRQYLVNIRAQSSVDPAIVREIREVVRVRSDLLEGACPSP